MREIKFRAWDKVRKKWIDEADLLMESNGRVWAGDINNPPMINIEAENVVFYTGLKDRTETEIFEGDILEIPGRKTMVFIVEYEECGFVLRQIDNHYNRDFMSLYGLFASKIIGNHFEHPHLLQEESK